MKIAIDCKSTLLKKALYMFLQPLIVNKKQCEFIICDYESKQDYPVFYIETQNSHLKKPFSKDQLLSALDKFYQNIEKKSNTAKETQKTKEIEKKDTSLEEKIDALTMDFRNKLIQTIHEYYES